LRICSGRNESTPNGVLPDLGGGKELVRKLLRVVGHLPLMDEATGRGGRCPTSLRGGNRGPGSLGGAARTMGIVALAVVAGSVRLTESGWREAVADGDGVAKLGSLSRRICRNDTQERALMQR